MTRGTKHKLFVVWLTFVVIVGFSMLFICGVLAAHFIGKVW